MKPGAEWPVHTVKPSFPPSRGLVAPRWTRFMGRRGSGSWAGKCGNDERVWTCIFTGSGV